MIEGDKKNVTPASCRVARHSMAPQQVRGDRFPPGPLWTLSTKLRGYRFLPKPQWSLSLCKLEGYTLMTIMAGLNKWIKDDDDGSRNARRRWIVSVEYRVGGGSR